MTFPNKLTRHSKEEKAFAEIHLSANNLLGMHHNQKQRDRETDSQPDTLKKKRECAQSELFLSLILWLRFESMFQF